MITIRKLSRLKRPNRIKKSTYLLRSLRDMALMGEELSDSYLRELISLLLDEDLDDRSRRLLFDLQDSEDPVRRLRLLDDAHHSLLSFLDIPVADWDLIEYGEDRVGRKERTICPFTVYLDGVRSPFNVGSVFRTADSFGVKKILIGAGSASPEHPRAIRTARGCVETVPWEVIDHPEQLSAFPDPMFALELGGAPIDEFTFPARGTVIIGSEELGVSPDMLKAAEESLGKVSIPLAGTKGSLNVSVAFGILMQYWFASCRRSSV